MPQLTTGPGPGGGDPGARAATGAGTPARAGAIVRASRWWPAPYLLFGSAFWLVVAVTAWRTPIASDFGQHASAVQRVADDWWHPANPLLKEPGTGSPYYSPYVVTLGLVARATGAAGWQVVRCCGPVNLAVLVAGVGMYARTLSSRRMAPVYALAMFTLLWGVRGKEWSGFCGMWSLTHGAAYPSCFAVGMTFVLWTWADRLARRGGGWPGFAGLGLLGGVLLLVHPITALAAAVGLAAVVAGRQQAWSRAVAGRWAVTVGAALAVTVAWPYFDVFALAGDTTVDWVHRRLYTHPWQWYGLALTGLPALVLRARRHRLDPLVLMFAADCLIVGYGWVAGHYTYGRVFALLLVPLQFALATELAGIPPWTRVRAVLAPLAAVALCFGLLAQIGAVVPQRYLPLGVRHPADWPSYRWVANRVPVGSVVLTDGYFPTHVLPAYGLFLVAPTWPDPSTSTAERNRRGADLRTYLDPGTPAAVRSAIVRRYGVGWLLLSADQRAPYGGRQAAVSPVTGERLIRLPGH